MLRLQDGYVVRGTSRLGPPIDITSRIAEVTLRPRMAAEVAAHRRRRARPGCGVEDHVRRRQGQQCDRDPGQGSSRKRIRSRKTRWCCPMRSSDRMRRWRDGWRARRPGAELRGYIAPQAEIPITVTAVAPERIETPKGVINVTRYALILQQPAARREPDRQPVGRSEPRSDPHEHSRAVDRAGARGHCVRGSAHRGLLTSRRRAGDDPGARIQSRRHHHQAENHHAGAGADPDWRLRSHGS